MFEITRSNRMRWVDEPVWQDFPRYAAVIRCALDNKGRLSSGAARRSEGNTYQAQYLFLEQARAFLLRVQ